MSVRLLSCNTAAGGALATLFAASALFRTAFERTELKRLGFTATGGGQCLR